MKGVILAGGLGTRLRPLTDSTNKHLLIVHDRPMIEFSLAALADAGVRDVIIVTAPKHASEFCERYSEARKFGFDSVQIAEQSTESGIAGALMCAEPMVGESDVCVILGDNLLEYSIREAMNRFHGQEGGGARVILKRTDDPSRFAIASIGANQRIVDIVEKPDCPASDLAVIGVYFYDCEVFSICRSLQPSARGELEITDVNRVYMRMGKLDYETIEGWWIDAGTHDSLARASHLVATAPPKHLNGMAES